MNTVFDRYRLAELHLELGDPLEALSVLGPLQDEIAGHAAGLLLLGRAYYHSAQLEHAQETFERVVELDPTDTYARFALGRTLERRNRLAQAVGHYRIATAMSDRAEYRERLDDAVARLPRAAGGE